MILYCVLFPGRDNIKRQQPPYTRGTLFRRVYYDSNSALRHVDVPPATRVPIAAKTGNHLATPG